MEIVRLAVGQPRAFLLGVGTTAALIAVGFLLATVVRESTPAQAQVSGNVAACVSLYTGQARFMYPGREPNCNGSEFPVVLGSGAVATDMEARLSALENQVPTCLSDDDGTALFTGCNVQIVSGSGETDGALNGTGNLIVGYNENPFDYDRSGSHNVIIGELHGYSSSGGLVAGVQNRITGDFASITGGADNEASGVASSINGGNGNTASGEYSSVGGGFANQASGDWATVSGGANRTASTSNDWVAGTLFEDE